MKTIIPSSFAAAFIVLTIISCRLPTDTVVPDGESSICGELAASNYVPVTLDSVLCIARDADGTLYVIDQNNYNLRCFISAADTLRRKKVSGSGIYNQQYFFISLEGGQQLLFENNGGIWSDAHFCRTGKCQKCDSIFSSAVRSKDLNDLAVGWERVCSYLDTNLDLNCPALATAEISDLNNYPVRNFPPTTHIEYLSYRQDGNYLLVTRPEYDWRGEVVVHYGKPGDLKMRTTSSFLRLTDGGSTWIKFKIGSADAEAFFGVAWDSVGIHEGKTWMAIDRDTVSIERIQPGPKILIELGIECDHEIG